MVNERSGLKRDKHGEYNLCIKIWGQFCNFNVKQRRLIDKFRNNGTEI